MAKKQISLRLPDDMLEHLQSTGISINAAVERDLDRLQKIRAVSMSELKGRFSQEEWYFLADCFNGTIVDATFCANALAMSAAMEDHATMNGAAERWQVEIDSLLGKVQNLTGAQIEAVYNRIDLYWNDTTGITMEEWAKW